MQKRTIRRFSIKKVVSKISRPAVTLVGGVGASHYRLGEFGSRAPRQQFNLVATPIQKSCLRSLTLTQPFSHRIWTNQKIILGEKWGGGTSPPSPPVAPPLLAGGLTCHPLSPVPCPLPGVPTCYQRVTIRVTIRSIGFRPEFDVLPRVTIIFEKI